MIHKGFLERFFFKGRTISVKTEIEGGIATFFTMSYIIFVQPAVLSGLGMDFGAVMMATCLSSAIATFAMAFLANYPIALAPGMGHNFLFVIVAGALGITWNQALALICISGTLFIVLSVVPFREKILNDIPDGLKHGIAVGIGLLITLIGLEWSGIVVSAPGTYIGMGSLKEPAAIITIAGLLLIVFLHQKGISSAIIWGILFATLLSLVLKTSKFHGIVSMPPSIAPTFFQLDFKGVFDLRFVNAIFVFLFLDVFDTVGTLVGVGEQGRFMVNGKLPKAKEAFLADAIGTVSGSLLGTSTVTSYIESAAGVSVGAKTGLASIVTGALLLCSIFFFPLVQTVAGGYAKGNAFLYPTIAPAMIFVGFLMMINLKKMHFDDIEEGFPAFISMIIIPLTFSITDGIAMGFIAYTVLKIVKGKFRDLNALMLLLSVIFIAKYVLSIL